jgi:release factor glutamine methyltransferase
LTIAEALHQGTQLLEAESIAAPRLTAEVLLAHALQQDRAFVYAHGNDELTRIGWIHYGRYLHERLKGKPTQYITGRQEFYGREFRVTRAVLIPRPETEHVVEAAIARIRPGDNIVDVGTGSGAIAITAALETRARVCATDISEEALRVAQANAKSLEADVAFIRCDLLSCLASGSVDAVLSNPPYVPRSDETTLQREVRDWEPHVALFAGDTGMEMYARIIAEAERVLRPGGAMILELGYTAAGPVTAMVRDKWQEVELIPDLAGIPRVLAARYRK